MSLSTIVPETVVIRRGRLLGLVAGIAAVAATVTGTLTAYAVGSSGQRSVPVRAAAVYSPVRSNVPPWLTPQQRSYLQEMTPVCAVLMCPPDEWLGARLGNRSRK